LVDTNIKCCCKRSQGCSNQSLYYCHSLACYRGQNRGVYSAGYNTISWLFNNLTETALKLLSTLKSDSVFIDAMAIMVSRFITTHMPYFHYACSGIVTWYCEHQYYKGMNSKSEVVCILSRYFFLDVNYYRYLLKYLYSIKTRIEILKHLHSTGRSRRKYLHSSHECFTNKNCCLEKTSWLLRGWQTAMSNRTSPFIKLKGLFKISIHKWFSLRYKFILVTSWFNLLIVGDLEYFYGIKSDTEHCTLHQLKNLLN